jgi:hypothetical protein
MLLQEEILEKIKLFQSHNIGSKKDRNTKLITLFIETKEKCKYHYVVDVLCCFACSDIVEALVTVVLESNINRVMNIKSFKNNNNSNYNYNYNYNHSNNSNVKQTRKSSFDFGRS